MPMKKDREPQTLRRGQAAARRRGPGALIRRLIQRMTTPAPSGGDARAGAPEALSPEGKRSGSGSESIAPYLDHGRSTRPGPLE